MRKMRGLLFADPVIILATIGFGTLGIITSFFDKAGTAQIWLARRWARTLLAGSGIRVRVEGLEHLVPGGSYVFMANHLSYMDTPVALATVPVQFRFLAKSGLFQIPFLGQHLKSAGHIPVLRGDPRASVKTMAFAAEVIQRKNISLLIFPEGGRSHDGVLQPFKEGGTYIAIRAGVPLVPLVFIGTREVLPFGAGIALSGDVTLRVLPPIGTGGLTLKDRGRVTEVIRDRVLAELQQAKPTED